MKISIKGKNFHPIILFLSAVSTVTYSFTLAYKRYTNFEYGKFDLGNMSQMVWNTSRGRFMEVTDQFGTNMPRWGMSHVDPILAVFASIYPFFDNPMILVFAQHVLILSAIFPLFWLVKKKTENILAGYLTVATYILYPAIGFTLIWTGFHGISFVAPLFIWIIWFLEENNFFVHGNISKKHFVIYWALVVLMLMGKEEIGAILALSSIPLFFKNRRLAFQTFFISIVWFWVAFFVIIPSYSGLREESIFNFTEKTGAQDVNKELASGENFFLQRYEYLGDSYGEMLKNAILQPKLVTKIVFTEDKINSLNNLIGPLGYVVISIPIWLIAIPDLAIVLLSKDEIFDISNHRIAFVISALFISYVYFLSLFRISDVKKGSCNKPFAFLMQKYGAITFSFIVLIMTIFFSAKTQNPLYISGKSFIEEKIIKKAFADKSQKQNKSYQLGDVRDARVPRNDNKCLTEMVQLIKEINPDIYSGPDYLGAHSANRRVNALFPARYWDADLIIADLFETKTIGPLESTGWTFNKEGLRRMLDLKSYKHIYSCGKVSAFVKGDITDLSRFIQPDEIPSETPYILGTDRIKLAVSPEYIPILLNRKSSEAIVLNISKESGNFLDKTTFWTFENIENGSIKVSFTDYLSSGSRQGLDQAEVNQWVVENYTPIISKNLSAGDYHVFFGVGDLLNAKEVYIGDISIK